MASYQQRMQQHLVAYKDARLGKDLIGTYKHRGREISYPHVLPLGEQWLNILEPHRARIRAYTEGRFRLHKYFHHLNSSQAFALNVFVPFLEGAPAHRAALLRAMGLAEDCEQWAAEHVVDPDEGTNADVAWRHGEAGWTYCEVKLTEQEFGTASGNERHEAKLAGTYAPVLHDYCPADLLEKPAFFSHYQILRNLWLAARAPGNRVVFFIPRANEPLWEPLRQIRARLAPSLQSRMHLVAVEDCLQALQQDARLEPGLRDYAAQLAEKYVLPSG